MWHICRAVLFTLIVSGVWNSAATSEAPNIPTSVVVNKESLISDSEVLLKDIASIASSDEALADKLRNIQICSAAEPGLSKALHIGYVKSRVRQQGILPESIQWGGSEQITVKTKSQILSPQEILSYAEQFIIKQVNPHKKEENGGKPIFQASRIEILPISDIQPAILPYGEVAVKVEPMPGAPGNGNIPLRLIISVDGRVHEKRIIFFKVTVLKDVLVAAQTLNRHKVIAADDLVLALRNVGGSLARSSFSSQKAELVGMRAKRMIRAGTAVTGDMVEGTPIINRGDIVTIIIESRSFTITTQGKARQAGARHEMIRVTNISSMKEITAEVIDEKLVRVAFAGRR